MSKKIIAAGLCAMLAVAAIPAAAVQALTPADGLAEIQTQITALKEQLQTLIGSTKISATPVTPVTTEILKQGVDVTTLKVPDTTTIKNEIAVQNLATKMVYGKVVDINGNTIVAKHKDGNNYKVHTANTKITKDGVEIKISEVVVGDPIRAVGELNGSFNINAKTVVIGQEMPVVLTTIHSGTVEAVDTGSFTLKMIAGIDKNATADVKSSVSYKTVKVTYTANTTFTKNGKPATSADLSVGMHVTVKGAADSAGNIAASAVTLIEAVKIETQVKPAPTTVSTGFMANGLEKLLNQFEQKIRTATTFDTPLTLSIAALTGTAKSTAAGTVITVTANGTDYTVETAAAKIVNKANQPVKVTDIKSGDKLTVIGELTAAGKVKATVIRDLTLASVAKTTTEANTTTDTSSEHPE